MWLDAAVRRDASQAGEKLRTWSDAFRVSAAASALKVASSIHDPTAHVLAGWSAVSTLLSVAAGAAARAKDRIANDPPDKEYEAATRAQRRTLDLGEIRPISSAAGSAAETGLELGVLMFDEASQATALVRAFERAQGSIVFGRRLFLEERLREVARFAATTTEDLRREASLAIELARTLKSEADETRLLPAFEEPLTVGGNGQTLASVLPSEMLAVLYRSGIRIGELREPIPRWRIDEPVAGLPAFLRDGVPVLERLADALDAWEPGRDLDVRESE